MAGKNRAYPVLMETCKKFDSNSDMLTLSLRAFCSLCNGQPDLLDEDGIVWNCDKLNSTVDNSTLAALLVRFMRLNCIKHETNRQKYVACDIVATLSKTLDKYKDSREVLKEVCGAFRVLTNDDDVRVPFGKAHDHAKMIVTEENALRKIMGICNGLYKLTLIY